LAISYPTRAQEPTDEHQATPGTPASAGSPQPSIPTGFAFSAFFAVNLSPFSRQHPALDPDRPCVPCVLCGYQTEDGRARLEVRVQGQTVWLSLNQMAELFHRDKSVISRHIRNVFEERELRQDSVVANYATTAADGKSYQVEHYNLDVIISVGYRVKSHRGTQFRIWATQRLREYIVKGFTLHDERLKRAGGGNYFEELLARIRDIRSSEKVFWRKVLEIYATSIDYDPSVEMTLLAPPAAEGVSVGGG
jgi:ribosomal protein L24E